MSMLCGLGESDAAAVPGVKFEVLSQQVKRAKEALGDLSLLGSRVFELRRLTRVGGTPVALITSYLDPLRFPGIHRLDFNDVALDTVLARSYGATLTRAVSELQLARASRDHAVLDVAPSSLLMRVTSTTYCEDGPVEYVEILCRSESFRLRFESLHRAPGLINVDFASDTLVT
jgi:DNA-binding GntR family transcriptional regulator